MASLSPESAAQRAEIFNSDLIEDILLCMPSLVTLKPITTIKRTISTARGSTAPRLEIFEKLCDSHFTAPVSLIMHHSRCCRGQLFPVVIERQYHLHRAPGFLKFAGSDIAANGSPC